MTAAHQNGPDAARIVGLSKSFPRRRTVGELLRHPLQRAARLQALEAISLTIARGELVGLLGPNGAGKTTLIKILCGLVLSEEGTAEILGTPVASSARARVLGLVHGEERSFYWRLTGRENLTFFARLHGLDGAARRQRVERLLEQVELTNDADRRFGDFSSGMRQRLAIARALLADPPVILMDEPTRSLDPVSAAHLRRWIQDELHHKQGKTILLATHNLREAEALCDRVAILAKGRLVAVATPAELRRRGASGLVYRLRLHGPVPGQLQSATTLEQSQVGAETTLRVHLGGDEAFEPLLAELHQAGARLVGCTSEDEDLEAIFHRLVGETEPSR